MKKLLNSKATECRTLLFIPGPVCCCRIQEWVLLPIFDIGHCSAAVQCRGAGVTAPHLTPPSLWAKIEQPLEETLMRCTTERCSCCSVGCKYNHHLSMYKLSPHLLRTLWSQPVTPWCCSAAVLQSPSPACIISLSIKKLAEKAKSPPCQPRLSHSPLCAPCQP